MVKRQRGITFKFVIISSALAIVLLSLMTFIIINSARTSQGDISAKFIKTLEHDRDIQEEAAQQDIKNKGMSIAMLLGKISSNFIIGYDFDSLQELATHAAMDQDIVNVLFTDPDNKPLTKSETMKSEIVEIKQPIKFEDKIVGQVLVRLSMARINKSDKILNDRIFDEKAEIDRAITASTRHLTIWFAGLAFGLIILLCLTIYLCLRYLVIKPITMISSELNETTIRVADASGELTGSSLSLADDSSSQAASLEEISASMEEIATMTRQNSDNAGECDNLMKDVNEVVSKANESIIRQNKSMNAISAASEETAKIIKTIDEIAFQTNLLALNAAVEAARAGEAGAGFAVVADEVRSLAMRSAEAAKNTSLLIEETTAKVNEGSNLAAETNKNFSEVEDKVAKAGHLVSEISTASNEQTIGLDQVNTAISEIDEVTQRTAANSEETASAASELLSLSRATTDHIDNLMLLLSGGVVDNNKPHPTNQNQSVNAQGEVANLTDNFIPMDTNDDIADF